MDVELSIITVNYNGLEDTCALIDTIPLDQTIEVIVVDNGSTIDEAAIVRQRYPHVTAIRSEQNLGFAGGNNIGIRKAAGKYLFLINNDTIFKDFNAPALIQRLAATPEIAMVCPKIRFAWSPQPIQFAGYTPLSTMTLRNQAIGYGEDDHGQYDTPHPTPYAHGAAMMVKREAVERVGLMPECYFLYYEELDWSKMLTNAGYQIWYDPACTIFHKESQSTGVDSPLKIYYIVRNRLLFASRHCNGLERYATYCYLTSIVAVRDVLRHLLRRRPDLAKATLRGICDFYFSNKTTTIKDIS